MIASAFDQGAPTGKGRANARTPSNEHLRASIDAPQDRGFRMGSRFFFFGCCCTGGRDTANAAGLFLNFSAKAASDTFISASPLTLSMMSFTRMPLASAAPLTPTTRRRPFSSLTLKPIGPSPNVIAPASSRDAWIARASASSPSVSCVGVKSSSSSSASSSRPSAAAVFGGVLGCSGESKGFGAGGGGGGGGGATAGSPGAFRKSKAEEAGAGASVRSASRAVERSRSGLSVLRPAVSGATGAIGGAVSTRAAGAGGAVSLAAAGAFIKSNADAAGSAAAGAGAGGAGTAGVASSSSSLSLPSISWRRRSSSEASMIHCAVQN